MVIGTCAGVLGFVDISASGNTNRFGYCPAPSTEFFETTNSPGIYEGSVEYTGLLLGSPVLFLSNHPSMK